MHYLSTFEIDEICKKILYRAKTECPYYYPHIYLLYLTGCRIGEVFNSRISYDEENNELQIIAQKKNYTRIIPGVLESDLHQTKKLTARQDLFYLNIRNLQRVLKKLMPIRDIRCGKKNIGAHIFRHNYIRKLFASGKSIEDIDRHLGYTSQTVADTYLSAIIYYKN